MKTWAIGDIQGCFSAFETLLTAIDFRSGHDHLWLAGDLVNRGPDSLAMLRWAMAHDKDVTMVLGNHDLHLLAAARGYRRLKRKDTLQPILDAPDRDALLLWLRHRPLVVQRGQFTMFHAGLAPGWSVVDAVTIATEIEDALRGADADEFLRGLRGKQPAYSQDLQGFPRLWSGVAALTRLRCCEADGAVTAYVGPAETCPKGQRPWYDWRRRPGTLLFGHWAAHGHQQWLMDGDHASRLARLVSLDSGAVWGGQLTAWCLEDERSVAVPGWQAE